MQSVIRAGSTGIREVLLLAHVDDNIACLRRNADDHALVYRNACADEQRTALLSIEQTIGDGRTGLPGNEGAYSSSRDIAEVRLVGIKRGIHDAFALGVGHELASVTEQTSGRNQELKACAVSDGVHGDHLTLALTHALHYGAYCVAGNVRNQALNRLAEYAVDLLGEYTRRAYGKLVTLAAHGLDEYRQVHFTASCYIVCVQLIAVGHAQGYVLECLLHQALSDLAGGYELALSAGKRAGIYGECHFNRRL